MADQPLTIRDLFREPGRQMRSEFEELKKNNPHFGERGAEAEIILRELLNQRLPKRWSADTGLVIDHLDKISRQLDVIIYDADNSPILRRGSRLLIVPNDNVAAVVQVKSSLSKHELEDAATNIASAKSLTKSPITGLDQPVTLAPPVMTRTLGVAFAYESTTSLPTLADNLKEINSSLPSNHWIDLVVVLDKGVIGYTIQLPFSSTFSTWFAGETCDDFVIPPVYVHLVHSETGELTLDRFFMSLIAHLAIYRKRSTIPFQTGNQDQGLVTMAGYQYTWGGNLFRSKKRTRQASS